MLPIAQYSRDCLRALRGETGIAYDERSRSTLQLFRTQRQFDDMAKDVAILGDLGVRFETLDTSGCIGAEPGLARSRADIVGGLRLPDDETGDCHAFTTRLASLAADLGVRFSFGVEIQRIVRDGSSVNSVITSQGRKNADAYVVALGSHSSALLKPLGVRIPVYPVKVYSLTASIISDEAAPVSTVMDETYKTAITRLGKRVRIGGTAELAGFDHKLRLSRRRTGTLGWNLVS